MSHEETMKIKNVKLRPENVLKIKSQEGQILLRIITVLLLKTETEICLLDLVTGRSL